MIEDTDVVARLTMLLSRGLMPDRARRHEYRPETWSPWMGDRHPAATGIVNRFSSTTERNRGWVARSDLAELANAIDGSDRSLMTLFVATMLWGSGTRNGRGPRYTAAALDDDRLLPSLRRTRQLVLEGQPGEAYRSFRANGVGPSFFTKWFWAVALDQPARPRALILDTRVWASLGELGWDSRTAARSRKWSDRYVAYLNTMDRWTQQLDGVDNSERLEQLLFSWAGGR